MTSATVEFVTSKDGTTIAYDRLGQGPAVVLVSGGSVDRSSNAGLAEQLAGGFTVVNYDRRGRGPSGDTQPYAIEREIEDIDAVIGAGRRHGEPVRLVLRCGAGPASGRRGFAGREAGALGAAVHRR